MRKNQAIVPPYQLFTFMVVTQMGARGLSLPFNVFTVSGSDGWISVILSGLFIQSNIFLLWFICRKYPTNTLFEITKKLLGKIVGNFLNTSYIAFFITTAITTLVIYTSLLKEWILPYTPNWILLLLFIFICSYLVRGGIKSIASLYSILFPLNILMVIFLAIAHKNAHYLFVLPIGNEGLEAIVLGAKEGIYAMTGYELLIVIYPFIQGQAKDKLKMMTLSNIFVTTVYTFVTFTSIVYFSPQEFLLVPEPVLYMIKEFTFIMIERVDLFFLCFVIFFVGATYSSYLYASSIGLASLMNTKKIEWIIPLVAATTVVVGSIPKNDQSIQEWVKLFSNISFLFIFVFPVILFMFSFFRKNHAGG
ncbi:GerAB/ArcD/ProY family transporter [Evansella sp. AB-P1]|uniref:GerAB/ArcD/ProY family transporter n=1 Tax=Evansella sp. AB-P1 TaxID=3037653 RepID=UPI00241FA499|nr:GerAB/ArcD/ProY family transporter [Evansella sp. AB-P1]MDG5789254.1 GerAB/ArcD/ProY family transporter [Evansella sp. AB-P1]